MALLDEQTPEGYTGPTEGATVSDQVDQPEVTAGNEFITPEATVSGQLATILAEGSPLQDLAQARSDEEANRRGLLSSTMAVGAGQRALYDTALQVATPDAATFAQAGLAEQGAVYQLGQTGYEGDITSKLKGQEGLIQAGLAEQEGDIQSKLLTERGEIEQSLQTDQQIFERALTEYKSGETYNNLITELASLEGRSTEEVKARVQMNTDTIAGQWKIADAEIVSNAAISMAKIDSSNQQAFLDSNKDILYGYNNALESILTNPDMSPEIKAEAANILKEDVIAQISMNASVFESTVTWDTGDPIVVTRSGDRGDAGDTVDRDTTPVSGTTDRTRTVNPDENTILGTSPTDSPENQDRYNEYKQEAEYNDGTAMTYESWLRRMA